MSVRLFLDCIAYKRYKLKCVLPMGTCVLAIKKNIKCYKEHTLKNNVTPFGKPHRQTNRYTDRKADTIKKKDTIPEHAKIATENSNLHEIILKNKGPTKLTDKQFTILMKFSSFRTINDVLWWPNIAIRCLRLI